MFTMKDRWPYRWEIFKGTGKKRPYHSRLVNNWNGENISTSQGHPQKSTPMNTVRRFVKLLSFFGIIMEIRDLTLKPKKSKKK